MVLELLSFGKITLLALANSVNPCQIAMLVLVLITILTQNQEKKKRVLFAGLAFISAVYIGYLFYGIVLVQLFQTFTEALRQSAIYVKYAFATLSMSLEKFSSIFPFRTFALIPTTLLCKKRPTCISLPVLNL